MRAFIAIDIPQHIKKRLNLLVAEFQTCNLACTWVNPDNAHLTLKFLGDIHQEHISRIHETMEKTVKKFSTFTVSLAEYGFFPNEKRPRVFFINTTKSTLLKSIADILEGHLEKCGFEKEMRFRSHITLARIKAPQNIDRLIEKTKEITLSETFEIREIVLYKSTLTGRGPIYERKASSTLTTPRTQKA